MRRRGLLACALACAACTGMPAPTPSPSEPGRARNDLNEPAVTQIAMHPARPETIFALTPFAVGLLKSVDGGRTWVLANRGIRSYFLSQVVIDPRDPDVVYVGAGGGGLYKSVDGGADFVEKNDGLDNTNIGSLVLHPDHPDRLYAVTSTGVYISPDGGDSWMAWNQGDDFTRSQQFQDLVILPSTPETVLLASGRGVFARRRDDDRWTPASSDLEGYRVTALAVHPDGRRVFAGVLRDGATLQGGGLYVTEDRGATWTRWDDGLERQWIRAIRFDPRRRRVAYLATSTLGVLVSEDDGLTWHRVGAGLGERDVRALTIDPVVPSRLYAGTLGKGLFQSLDSGRRWAPLEGIPIVDADTAIASLNARASSPSDADLRPPPAFSKCNRCHGWTDQDLNQAHSFWRVPANRRDWGPTVRRMSSAADLTSKEETEIREFLSEYSSRIRNPHR